MKTAFFIPLFAMLFVACTVQPTLPAADNAEQSATNLPGSGDVVWLAPSDPVSMDPHRVGDHPSWNAQSQVFEGLTWFDENHVLQPLLAYSFEQIEPTVWEFVLRQDVYFSDGEPFNAYAVLRSLDRVRSDHIASPSAPVMLGMVSDITIESDYIIRVHTFYPFAPLPTHFTTSATFIVSPAAIAYEEAGGTTVSENPVGTGPFVQYERIHGDRIYFVRNPYYWNGPISFERLIWRVIPDTNTRLAMLETGEANGMQGNSMTQPLYSAMENVSYVLNIAPTIHYLSFNLNTEYLADPFVRRAINHAINREAILIINEGGADLATSTAPPFIDFAPQGLLVPERDLEYAHYLLSQSQWPNGGFTIGFWYNIGNSARQLIAELLHADLAALNITVEIEAMEWGAYMESIGAGLHDMFILGWSIVTLDADNAFFGLYHSSNFGASGNRAFFSNPTVDALIEEGHRTGDPLRRQEIYNELGEILAYYIPIIPLWHPHNPFPYTGIDGLHVCLRSVPFFQNVRLI
ncbi:MAG: ABC transporter substrate-binding protein [Defluviitaleaceae bacterium]|nr:ABC transporter substrate-binding protein [Defluviitaleaceae bacterium]